LSVNPLETSTQQPKLRPDQTSEGSLLIVTDLMTAVVTDLMTALVDRTRPMGESEHIQPSFAGTQWLSKSH
jgi:hypothetical protein